MRNSKVILISTPIGTNMFYQKWVEQENKMNEQAIQAKIQKYIKARGGYVVKTITSNRAGIPDILCCIDGKFIGIEVKVPGKQASPLQLANGELIEAAGGLFLVATNAKEVAEFLDAYL